MSLFLPSVQAWKGNSHVTETVMKLVCVCTQVAIKQADSVMWPSLSLTRTHTHTHTHTKRCAVSLSLTLSLSLSLSHTHTHTHGVMQNSAFEQSIANT